MASASLAAKRLARSCLTTFGRLSGALARAESHLQGQLVVLCYHRILPASQKACYFSPDLVVTPEAFRRHCAVLHRHYRVATLTDACDAIRSGSASERPWLAITFDDGYRDNFMHAAPILREFTLPATFFVIAGLVETEARPWYDQLGQAISGATAGTRSAASQNNGAALRRVLERFHSLATSGVDGTDGTLDATRIVAWAKGLPPDQRGALVTAVCDLTDRQGPVPPEDQIMTWAQLRSLRDAGHEIGSHGLTHEILPRLGEPALTNEIVGSKQVLEAALDTKVRSFCYPNGDHDNRVIETVRSSGYTWATSVVTGTNAARDVDASPLTLKRRFIHEERLTGSPLGTSGVLLRSELCGLSDALFRRRRGQAT